ncbi:Sorbin and SH3 domain-containing protein 1 [Madurella mycetomatis]|uniref:Sorbin and SH3 domain-containing protein 1 n=1 Tax=Madurella mycetomatis TaxID=100816 RepID=A0A175WGC7_9PEZI|nr:Sorbin and SH3 domain-containing protein 1 [Madurella mycetomatis]
MAIDAEELLLRPLHDVVSLGSAAVVNASTHHADPMLRAAQALVREGDRALKKVRVVWKDQVERHGDAFKDVMVQQASIEKRRLRLEDLLWDFDDVIQPDEFDHERYAALQAATKALALDIVETAKRLKLDIPPPAMPRGGFPPLPPLPTDRAEARTTVGPRPQSARSIRPRALSRPKPVRRGTGFSDHAPSGGVEEWAEIALRNPGPDLTWGAGVGDVGDGPCDATTLDHIDTSAEPEKPRREMTATAVAMADWTLPDAPYPPRELRACPLSREALTPPSSPAVTPLPTQSRNLILDTSVRPTQLFDPAPTPGTPNTRASLLSKTGSITSSSALLGSLDSLVISEEPHDPNPYIGPNQLYKVNTFDTTSSRPVSEEADVIGSDDISKEPGPATELRKSRPVNPRAADFIIHSDSTYHKLKGLCKGAVRFRKDGHWGSIKLTTEYDYGGSGGISGGGDMLRASDGIVIPLQYELVAKVGACGDCGYAHDLDEVKLDKSDKPEGIRTSDSGARYRLRLLFKSHLREGISAEACYACLWCVQAGTTTREGDATVFRSADDLLRHLARHPQPLPLVDGVSVRYGQLPELDTHDFDLHLPDAPIPVPLPDNVARLATATATRDHYRQPGRGKLDKPPHYDGEMLEFMQGARVVGVMFPEKWGGKWCLGRHDGMFGAFPTKMIEIRPPQESEIPKGGESGMSVTTRWKWQPPSAGETPWLPFAKGEVITNVQSLYADHWCWSGTNSKGKTGVFPQSHIDLQTLRGQDSGANKKRSRRGLFGYRSNSTAEPTSKGNRNSILQ